jgi:hypothetical protein
MSIRGQKPDAWIARWRAGTCPVHGVGFLDVPSTTEAACARRERDGCTVVVAQWPGKDAHHRKLGWVAGPDDVKAALVKAGQIAAEGNEPGRWAVDVRTSWPLEPE